MPGLSIVEVGKDVVGDRVPKEAAQQLIAECGELVIALLRLIQSNAAGRTLSRGSTTTVESITESLIAKQNEMYKVVMNLQKNQRLAHRIESLRAAHANLDARIERAAVQLYRAESELADTLAESQRCLEAARRGEKSNISADTLVNYAARIQSSLGAPPGWNPSIPLGSRVLPPAPTDDMMRASLLAQISASIPFASFIKQQNEFLLKAAAQRTAAEALPPSNIRKRTREMSDESDDSASDLGSDQDNEEANKTLDPEEMETK
mmetsp:Transcript_3244/g.5695  ORF Transcript_3244/g.5695 Transcript_3244/m.5695 type:complete len:264 (+) Transcript_3244:27-818(+)